jgi:histidyl-tRNA synthetase
MKRYHVGRVFKKTPKSFENRRNALESLEASFDILSLPT